VGPPPPPPRTNWTRRVSLPVLIGHAASLTCSVSKAALNAYARLRGPLAAARVVAVCPGDVATAMCSDWEAPALRTAEEAADGVLWAATDAKRCATGGFYREKNPIPF
jgi:NAD(P)-dependent dehydrogenase (short-subunit alcohol dehydrogenase family)